MAPLKLIQVGAGGFGKRWCREFLPENVRDGLIEVVAAVDINPDAWINAQEGLGLPPEKCYTDLRRAMDENSADFCTVVVPPGVHETVVDTALAHGLHILSEKPIASDLPTACRIAEKVRRAGKKMAVTVSHRFDQDKTTLRRELRSGKYGRLDYLICQHSVDRRKFGTWGAAFRYEVPDVQMVEGGVHYLDILADLAGAKCDLLYAQTWNTPWSEFKGDPQSFTMMHFENGTRAFIEMCAANAIELNAWKQEHWRAECELGTLILDARSLEVFPYEPDKMGNKKRPGEGQRIPLIEQRKWVHFWMIEQFVEWLNGGPPMETNVADNLQSVALFCAAIESSRTGCPVKVQDYLAETYQQVLQNDF